MDKTHPLQREYNRYRDLEGEIVIPKAHAEILCLSKIRHLDIDFEDTILYIYREWKDGTYATARPCQACYQFIRDLGIGTIVYTTNGGYAIEKIEMM